MPQPEPKIPLNQQIPSEPVASPGEVRPHDEGEQWYLPSWGETARLLGWRWIYFVPLIGLVVFILIIPFEPLSLRYFFIWWKPMVFAIAIPIGALVKATKNVVRNRKDPFCIHCGYGLTGLPDHYTCPECGRGYSFSVIEEYRRDPHWFIERYRKHKAIPMRDVPFEAGAVRRKGSRDGT
jgi:hypothetical protein